jgi:RsiW-degrading membrane proteinase PrsW (M82 family)
LDVLSFWPSLSLLVFFLVIFLECRTIAGRVTLPLGSFLMVFCYGAIGAPLIALLLQQIPIFPDASAAWLIGPPVEEIAKALPVIVLAFLTREARRLSIADLTLVGFASGAGFGFVEGNLNALANGALPSVQHVAALGLQTANGEVFFAGHPVSSALVGLAAGIGLRFIPLNIGYAWAPSVFVVLWASFDHGLYNWKVLNAASTGALPSAHFVVELLHLLTLNGQLQTWLLVVGVVIAQFVEAHLCAKAVGARRDLLLAREWRPWVLNEWLVVLLRAPVGRAVFGQTLAYFRLRRAYYLATFEERRDPGDPTWSRHARSLEDRLKRERSILFDPPPGTWLLPPSVLKSYALQWTWRMRWVLLFIVLFLLLFMLDPESLPDGLRQILFGEMFTIAVVAAGLAFAVWRIVVFMRQPAPDPLAADGAAHAGYYTRALLLGCSFVCGLFPALTLLLGWKAFAPGAALISGYLPGWIGQGGNLQALLGLGAIGAAVAPDPRPAGEAFRYEIAAGEERMRRLTSDIEDRTGSATGTAPATVPVQVDALLDAMAKLDAERDAQARRQLALDECERHAGEATIRDPAPAVQAVKDEFDRLASELLDAAAKELDSMASFEEAYSRAWAEIMRDLDAHDVLRRRLRTPLRRAWQAQNDVAWALRVVEATDENLLPMQLMLLPDLHALATTAQSARTEMVAAGIERIRAAAAEYGEADPFGLAGPDGADEDETALLAEFAPSAAATETTTTFGLRAAQPSDIATTPRRDTEIEAGRTETQKDVQSRGPYQKALDRLIDAPKHDAHYLETIRDLERSHESLQAVAPADEKPQSTEPAKATKSPDAIAPVTQQPDETEAKGPRSEPPGEIEDLLDTIKRESGYLDFAKETPPAPRHETPAGSDSASAHEAQTASAPEAGRAPDDATEVVKHEEPAAVEDDAGGKPVLAVSPGSAIGSERLVETPEEPIELSTTQATDTKPVDDVAFEAIPQTDEPDRALPDAEETQPADAIAARAQADEHAAQDAVTEPLEPQRAEDTSAHIASTDHAQSQDSARVEPHRTIEAEKPLKRDRSDDQAESRPSVFSRLFHSIRRQSDDSAAKPARWDNRPQEPKAKALDAEPAQPLTTSQIEDRTTALQPEQKAPEAETATREIAAPTAEWLADFASQKSDDVTALPGETALERIEWPALSPSAPENVAVPTPETATPYIDVAQPVEAPVAEDDLEAAGAPEPTADVAPTDTATPAERAEAAPAAAREPQKSTGEDVRASPAEDSARGTSAQALKPEGADEFASKADRLSLLLDKLEQAMQAKSAAVSSPADTHAAPIAKDKADSAPPERAADADEPSVAESEIADSVQEAEPTLQADRLEHSQSPIAEALAAAEPAAVQTEPTPEQPEESEPHTSAPSTTAEPAEPPDAALKSDRLSFLLTKLFDAVKRQPADQSVRSEEAEPLLDQGGSEPSTAGEVLDPRGPQPIPEPTEQNAPTPAIEPSASQASEGAEAPSDAPPEPVVAAEPLRAAGEEAPAHAPEESADRAPASEPVAAPDVSTAAASTPPSEEPAEPPLRPRAVETTHFGSRSRPPRPGASARVRDVAEKKKRPAPERSREPAEPESPATTPKRDWKLTTPARGETSKPVEPQSADTGPPKKPETTIRIKTGTGALATVDAPPPGSSAASASTPSKYYGPRLAKSGDDEADANTPANQRALSLADALTEYYAKTGQPQPPMHVSDRATLQRIVSAGKLEAPRRRGAAWSTSGMSRRGEVAIRLKPGAEQYIEFVPSTEIFGQVPHFYPRGVGKGSYATHVPVGYLEYFDVTTRQWAPLVRGRE